MTNNTKQYVIIAFTSIFILTLLYCTYNLNTKLNAAKTTVNTVVDEYSVGLISDHEFNTKAIEMFKQSPEATYRAVFENGTLTNSGRKNFTLLCNLKKNAENQVKIDSLDEQYMTTISQLFLYYSIDLKKLTDYKNVTNQQIDSLINYNNQAIKLVKELQQVK
jgi:hypothetical protein